MDIKTKGLLVGGGAVLVAYLLIGTEAAAGNGGAIEQIQARAGGILGSTGAEGGATPQNVYNIPGETFTGFPQPEGFDLSALLAGLMPDETPEETPDKPAGARPGDVSYADYEASYEATLALAYGDTTGRAYRPSIVSPLAAPGAAKKDITRAIGGAGRAISGAGVAGGGAIGAAVRDVPQVPAHVAKSGSAMGRAFSGLFGSVAAAATPGAKKVTTVQPSAAQTRAEVAYQKSVSIAYGRSGGGGGGSSRSTAAPKKKPSTARKKAERSYAKSVSIAYGK